MRNILEEGQGSSTRTLVDMDARIMALSQKIGQSEDVLEAKIQAVSKTKPYIYAKLTRTFIASYEQVQV